MMRRHTRLNHFLEKKSQSRKRRLSQTATLTGKQAKNIKRQLGV
ncbi:MAG: bL35 family ribosomal protein [Candidatus Saccharimonadales bacterium]